MTDLDKSALRDAMLALEAAELDAAREHYEAYLAESRLAENEPHERDEIASARIAADLAHGFDAPIHTLEAKIDVLENLDFGPKTEVGPGAVIAFNGRHFVVAVATKKFDFAGQTYMGLAQDSPIYAKIEGLTEGDSFEHNGKDMSIERVL